MAQVKVMEVFRFVTDCVVAAGSPRKPAEQLADLLLAADKCGIRSHGLNRLERYIRDIMTGLCCPSNTPKIINETASTAWVDANNALGATAGNFGTELAIQKAKATGVACVSVKGSNHFGIGGYYANKVSESGMVGLIFTNGSPLVAPTRGTKAALGTNPLSVVGPGLPSTGPLYLDISTATVSLGKIEMYRRSGFTLPPGWAQGPDGKETLDPDLAIKSGSLMPLGGTEQTGGYKGFALGALVDMLSGILSGAHFGHHVPKWTPNVTTNANIGHTFMAIDHKCFAPGFEERVSDVIEYWRNMKPADPRFPVLAPGDIEKKAIAEADSSGVLVYIEQLLDSCDKLAVKLKVVPLQRIKQGRTSPYKGPSSNIKTDVHNNLLNYVRRDGKELDSEK